MEYTDELGNIIDVSESRIYKIIINRGSHFETIALGCSLNNHTLTKMVSEGKIILGYNPEDELLFEIPQNNQMEIYYF